MPLAKAHLLLRTATWRTPGSFRGQVRQRFLGAYHCGVQVLCLSALEGWMNIRTRLRTLVLVTQVGLELEQHLL